MTDPLSLRIRRKLWTKLLGEDSWIKRTGDFRLREAYCLVGRENYAYGMLRAADMARYCGKQAVTVVEMGVASGAGLVNMIKLADQITPETGVSFNIFGFDTGTGLPSIEGHKDHPEIWNPGDFRMEDRDALLRKIAGRAKIIWGDINETIDGFTSQLSSEAPLGFVSVDVDIYSATKAGLRCLIDPDSTKYLPAFSIWFDDLSFFTANPWCGELAAIDEFNAQNTMRKLSRDRSLPGLRPVLVRPWYESMYVCHVLDHETRQRPRDRESLAINEHQRFVMAHRSI